MNITKIALATLALAIAAPAVAEETINFEGPAAGSFVIQVNGNGGSGPILVRGKNPNSPLNNAAMIFDSANPTGGDSDLGTPNQTCGGPGVGADGEVGQPFENCSAQRNILIVTEDFDASNPDDADLVGAMLTFDFAALGAVTIKEMTILDVEPREEEPAIVKLFSGAAEIASFSMPLTGNNGVGTMTLGPTAGVTNMTVILNGSGAIDNIVFTRCGNGVREDREQCDGADAEACPGACAADCTCEGQPECGDGYLDDGEECDDGNHEDGDGCSSTCEKEEHQRVRGCTPGYWKQPHHFDSWQGATPADYFNATFMVDVMWNVKRCGAKNITLVQALGCRGGHRNALARHATAGLLNSLNPDVNYALSTEEIKTLVMDAIDSGKRDDLNYAKDILAEQNEKGCPLN